MRYIVTQKHMSFGTSLLAVAAIAAGCTTVPTARNTTTAPVGAPVTTVSVPATTAPDTTPTTQPTLAPLAPTAAPQAASSPQPIPAATHAPIASSAELAYLDDRSAAAMLIDSFYNAISRKEYARAYSYWQAGAAGLPPYDAFAQGYNTTSAVQVGYGVITGDTGAGQTRFAVPIRMTAQTSSGAQYFVGCYVLHLASPVAQAALPFQPLAIESATVQQSTAPATAGALEQACPPRGAPVPQPGPDTGVIDASVYLDNQSDPVNVVRSFYNAINRHEDVRAYSYWQDQSQLPALADFTQGYANTQSVTVTTGAVQSDAGAGQRNYQVPITITSQMNDGSSQIFAGCYQLHLAEPAIQGTPFKPLGLTAANIQQVTGGASATDVMNQRCQAG